MSDVAADRAAISHGGIANVPAAFGQGRAVVAQSGRRRQFRMRRQRADPYDAVLDHDAFQLGDAADVDQRGRRRQSKFQQRNQAVSASQDLCARILSEQIAGFGNRAGAVIIEIRRVHVISVPALMFIARQTRSAVIGI